MNRQVNNIFLLITRIKCDLINLLKSIFLKITYKTNLTGNSDLILNRKIQFSENLSRKMVYDLSFTSQISVLVVKE